MLSEPEKLALYDLIMEELRFHKHRSFQQLLSKANRTHGFAKDDHKSPYYRGIDNALQVLKRRGVIEWFRFGTYKMWKEKA